MQPYKKHEEMMNGDRALINRVKKAGIETYNPRGEWNGYGYERLPLVAVITSLSDQRKFNKIRRELEAERQAKPPKPKKIRTQGEIVEAWGKRLVKLYNAFVDRSIALGGDDYDEEDKLTLDEAEDIALEKLRYQTERINEMIDRQCQQYSQKRESLIRKMERENPLRRIKNENHAVAIMEAHWRHTHGYDADLRYAHELEENGDIEKGTARDVARAMYNGTFDWNEMP